MDTILDKYHEHLLVHAMESDAGFSCRLQPLQLAQGGRLLPVDPELYIDINFGNSVLAHLIVPEIIQVGLGMKYADNCIMSEVETSPLIKFLGVDAFFPHDNPQHIVIKTSHQTLNVILRTSKDSPSAVHLTITTEVPVEMINLK
ncbi:hypothetical protein [Stenoxybacter acetivorans]|uniref:hypothetical protein n=1 Tax=Stenoxybacter acetivorans TaxID=422441 RepID=UPI00055D8586|nr:hypothetical protein [Stenoxybacter acetivorans]